MRLNQYHQRRRALSLRYALRGNARADNDDDYDDDNDDDDDRAGHDPSASARARARARTHVVSDIYHQIARIICENIPSNWPPIFIVISNT